jgi:short-subunit dehydrogenase
MARTDPISGLIGRANKLAFKAPYTPAGVLRRIRSGSLEDAVGGKVVMITGSSSGIGKASALRIGAAGGTVLLVARNTAALEQTQGEIAAVGGRAHVHPCDLSDLDAVGDLAAAALEQHGHVDVLVNNAAHSIRRSLELSYERMHDFQRTMQINYFGAVRLMLGLLPSMRGRRSGQIVNISSAGVQIHTPRFSAYLASKAALNAFSASIASEIRADGVHVTTVYMPLVRTPMIAPTKLYDTFPAISAEEAADMVAEAIVTRPIRISTRFGNAFELANAISPGTVESLLGAVYRRGPGSER